jgi:NTP pyrophosphatase (non-canonical NTP hydrolase)
VLDALVAEARLRWGLDPAAGLQVIAVERLVATPIEPSRPVLVVPLAALRAAAPGDEAVLPLPGRAGPGGGDALTVLGRLYPPGHPVGRFGSTDDTTIAALDVAVLGSPLYLRPLAPEAAVAGPWAMPWISSRLRQPDGCPWDREQTHTSLRNHLLEEAYEVYDALEAGATRELAGELGDLWLQVVLHAQLAAEEGVFDLTDVQEAIASKIVRRHPHVFGDAVARTASDVNRQWERIKADERAAAAEADERAAAGAAEAEGARAGAHAADAEGADSDPAGVADAEAADADRARADDGVRSGDGVTSGARATPGGRAATGARVTRPKSALDGISLSMPALAASQEMQERAANLGYDWPSIDGVLDKVAEEANELRQAATDAERSEEFGDLLFVLVNVARRRGIEAEAAVRAANHKFRRRFASVERQAADRGVALRDLDFAALDALWDAAKAEERTT